MFTRSSTAVLGSLHASESRLGHWQNQKDFQQIATKFDFFFGDLGGTLEIPPGVPPQIYAILVVES